MDGNKAILNGHGYSNAKNYADPQKETQIPLKNVHTSQNELEEKSSSTGFIRSHSSLPPMDKEEESRISLVTLFRFSDKLDVLLMVFGTLFMVLLGGAVAGNVHLFGTLTTKFILLKSYSSENDSCNHIFGEQVTEGEIINDIQSFYVPSFIGLAVGVFILGYLGITSWTWTRERQIRRVRIAYFQAIMKQSIGWFDVHNAGELNTRMVLNLNKLYDGMGDNLACLAAWLGTFISGYTLGFIASPKLSAVVLSLCPLMVICLFIITRLTKSIVNREISAYTRAGAVAEETFSSMRLVAAFGGEKKAEDRYSTHVKEGYALGVRKSALEGILRSFFWLSYFCITGLTFWFGAKMVHEECLAPGSIFQVFVGLLLGSLALGNAGPAILRFSNARAAAAVLYKTIDKHVEIDLSMKEGLQPDKIEGAIKFQKVNFAYSTRPEVQVLKDLNLTIRKGQLVALLGDNGSGKSTTIQLLQRFYECDSGQILIDGKDIREYDLAELRNHIGMISQEPVLFATTIGENIRLGAKWMDEVTQEDIDNAAKQANCYDFITQLPEGFDTLVGSNGMQLSGGQKQRITIARALVRNPSILLMDEPMTFLDSENKDTLYETLKKVSRGRTTLMITHSLPCVKPCDKICTFRDGKVHEEGTHDQLLAKKGTYYSRILEIQKEENAKARSSMTVAFPQRHQYLHSSSTTSILSNSSLGGDWGAANETRTGDAPHKLTTLDILAINKPEWSIITLGVICSVVSGCTPAVSAIIVTEIIHSLHRVDGSNADNVEAASLLAIDVVVLGIVAAIAYFLQTLTFGISGERLTSRLREQCFTAIVKQDMTYFDDSEHSVGLLTSRLSSEPPLVKGASGTRIGMMANAAATVVCTMIVAFYFVWELALLVLLFLPLSILVEVAQRKAFAARSKRDKISIENGGKVAHEAITNMKTVAAFNRQMYFTEKYDELFLPLHKTDKKKAVFYGITYAGLQSLQYVMYAICFGFGGYLAASDIPWREENISFGYIVRVFLAITLSNINIGESLSHLPNYLKAKSAAACIQELQQTCSTIDPTSDGGSKPGSCEGVVKFADVEFSYPARQMVQVLQRFSLSVKKGEKVALVGASGCGKSTSFSLLERFYDCQEGRVAVDGQDIRRYNIQWLRQQLAIVPQEPTLFNTSIAENIAYGDNTREVGMAEIIQAATKAKAHNFITALPEGYETNVGMRGNLLSGGQRQRIAIARALLRNPAIMLLDEATSALDVESAKAVQDSLEEALRDKTAIIIAHKLSTIRNAHKIGIIDGGKVVEFGTHEQLIEKKGAYHKLFSQEK
ncbi:ATP-dependent translocase ABCB1-like [Watersipora subatra]|uniref:ATP-dependent translocase ABCB1-like n=1 Tax=Watersipora subatra TaxID=2589382 RepID=UPI00355C5CA6